MSVRPNSRDTREFTDGTGQSAEVTLAVAAASGPASARRIMTILKVRAAVILMFFAVAMFMVPL
jgi:hypothetical protein